MIGKRHATTIAFFLLILSFVFAEVPSPFQFLKELSTVAAEFDIYVKFIVLFFALGLLVISVKAYLKKKSPRMLFLAAAFFLFAAKWGLKILDLYFSSGVFLPDPSENVFELAIFVMLFAAIFKK
ncbi:MAG: hypothetical protein V1672_05735 [Candidatus Diapherotrites archaeon]